MHYNNFPKVKWKDVTYKKKKIPKNLSYKENVKVKKSVLNLK